MLRAADGDTPSHPWSRAAPGAGECAARAPRLHCDRVADGHGFLRLSENSGQRIAGRGSPIDGCTPTCTPGTPHSGYNTPSSPYYLL